MAADAPDSADTMPWKQVLLVSLGTCSVLIGAMYGVGMVLPHDFEGRVTVDVSAPPETVWATIQDYRRLPISGGYHQGSTPLAAPEGQPAWQETSGESVTTIRTVAADKPRNWEIALSDSEMPLTAKWRFSLSPVPGGTRVSIVETGTIANGRLGAPMFRLALHAFGGVQSGLDSYAGALQAMVTQPAGAAPAAASDQPATGSH